MNTLLEQIKKKNAKAFTHSGKFHADDVFSYALLLYLNPAITITRGNKVPKDFDGIVFDIGRGKYDHHQKDSRIRENGIPYAAFGLLWEELGKEILGEELAAKFDESFIQPLDNNDNTGEKNERAEKRIEEILTTQESSVLSGKKSPVEAKILTLPEFIPCQKQLRDTEIAFIIFPSNRGGYCIQPLKRKHSLNYKCSFPESWLGLEGKELQIETGLNSANFCHKGGFIMTTDHLDDAISACKISLEHFTENFCIINLGASSNINAFLTEMPHMKNATVIQLDLPEIPELTYDGNFGEIAMEKADFKSYIKDYVKGILKYKPDAVYIEGELLITYPIIRALRKKHIPVYIKHKMEFVTI